MGPSVDTSLFQGLNARERIVDELNERGGKLGSALSAIQWAHSSDPMTSCQVPDVSISLPRLSHDGVGNHTTEEAADIGMMKFVDEVCSFSIPSSAL